MNRSKKRVSEISRTSFQQINVQIVETLMSDTFEEFVQEQYHQKQDLRILLAEFFIMISSSSIKRREHSSFKRVIYSKLEESFNVKEKVKAQKILHEENQNLLEVSKNVKAMTSMSRSSYTKISYNRDVVVILLIRKREQLNTYSMKFENIVSICVIFQLFSENKKENYLIEVERYLNLENEHFIKQSADRFQRWISRFRDELAATSKIIDFAFRQSSEIFNRKIKQTFSLKQRFSLKERFLRKLFSLKTKRDSSKRREHDWEFDFNVSSTISERRVFSIDHQNARFHQLSSRSFYRHVSINRREEREDRDEKYDRRRSEEKSRARRIDRSLNEDLEIRNLLIKLNEISEDDYFRTIIFDENSRTSREKSHMQRDSRDSYLDQRDSRIKSRIRYSHIDYENHVLRQNRRLQFVSRYSDSLVHQTQLYHRDDFQNSSRRRAKDNDFRDSSRHRLRKNEFQNSSRHRARKNEFHDLSRRRSRNNDFQKSSRHRERSHYNQEEYDQRQSVARVMKRSVKFRSQDVMLFDFEKQSVAFFIRRFQHIVELEDEFFVLRVLLMCLKDFALE
jgi:hypothetical protein